MIHSRCSQRLNGRWEGLVERSVPDAGTVGDVWVTCDPGRAGQHPRP